MQWIEDYNKRRIRLTNERLEHVKTDHPEMSNQEEKIWETISAPEMVVRSKTDPEVELFYRNYTLTPVTDKYLCVVVKVKSDESFVITAYFTDAVKRGDILWENR